MVFTTFVHSSSSIVIKGEVQANVVLLAPDWSMTCSHQWAERKNATVCNNMHSWLSLFIVLPFTVLRTFFILITVHFLYAYWDKNGSHDRMQHYQRSLPNNHASIYRHNKRKQCPVAGAASFILLPNNRVRDTVSDSRKIFCCVTEKSVYVSVYITSVRSKAREYTNTRTVLYSIVYIGK